MTRSDLGPGYQAVQSAHAAVEFSLDHPDTAREWRDASRYMAVLVAPDEAELDHLATVAETKGIPITRFYEPDIGDQLTAVAFAPQQNSKQLLSHLSLAGGGAR